jgi:prespore-specific regulator
MKTVRQDAWTEEDDRVLAEIILKHIAEGSTQLAAFEEASEKLGRTSAACGYRWNASVRKIYGSGIDIAKNQRRQTKNLEKKAIQDGKNLPGNLGRGDMDADLSWNEVFRFLKVCRQGQTQMGEQLKKLENDLSVYEQEMKSIELENRRLRGELQQVTEEYQQIKTDYRTMLNIFERARKLTLFHPDADNDLSNVRFRMDANGNLERI